MAGGALLAINNLLLFPELLQTEALSSESRAHRLSFSLAATSLGSTGRTDEYMERVWPPCASLFSYTFEFQLQTYTVSSNEYIHFVSQSKILVSQLSFPKGTIDLEAFFWPFHGVQSILLRNCMSDHTWQMAEVIGVDMCGCRNWWRDPSIWNLVLL